MQINKKFKFEGAHIVRDCSSIRCKYSIHGHSYLVEVKLESKHLDNGQMVVDFGLLKGTIKDFIDSFDHAYTLWSKESPMYKKSIKSMSQRWVELPVSPSAEMYSLMFFYVIDRIIKNTKFNNGEKSVNLHSIRVHETETGSAEAFRPDLYNLWNWKLEDIIISDPIKQEWKDPLMWDKLINDTPFINPEIKLEYQ